MTFSATYKPSPLEATFGYFNSLCSTTEHMKKMHRNINLMNGLGYIPIIGTIIGIARIFFFSQFIPKNKHYSKNELAFSCLQVGRGCIEMFSLGAIFLIPDLIFTINRELEIAMKENTWFHGNFGKFEGD
jgi:hypothetical protein